MRDLLNLRESCIDYDREYTFKSSNDDSIFTYQSNPLISYCNSSLNNGFYHISAKITLEYDISTSGPISMNAFHNLFYLEYVKTDGGATRRCGRSVFSRSGASASVVNL